MSISCSFCIHINPEGSKYCNECGSPLRLKPCGACEAVNDLDATHCHQCGTELLVESQRAHELAESLRTRGSNESSNGAEQPAADATPVFFDQYLHALRRDFGSRKVPAPEPPEEARPGNGAKLAAADTAKIVSIAPVGAAAARNGGAHAAPADKAKDAKQADEWQVTAQDAASALRPQPEVRPEPAAEAQHAGALFSGEPQPANSPAVPQHATPISSSQTRRAAPRSSAEALSPLRVTPIVAPMRRPMSPLLYLLGAALLVVGIIGYGYYQYGLPARADRWPGAVIGSPSTSQPANLLATASRAIRNLGGGSTTSSTASTPPTEATPTAEAASATSTRAATAKAANPASSESSAAPMAAADVAQRPESAALLATEPPVSPATGITPSQLARAGPKPLSKRPEPRKTAAVRPAIAQPVPAAPTPPPASAVDTGSGATTASPLAPVCTKGVAALGLCDSNRKETN